MYDITASIVTYKTNPEILLKAVNSFVSSTLNCKLYISDNSPERYLEKYANHPKIEYVYNGENLGFGKGHNIILKKITTLSKYHLILNPDVYFNPSVLNDLFIYMEDHKDIGLISPKVLYPDDTVQSTCRLIPSPLELFSRRLAFLKTLFKKRYSKYNLEDFCYSKPVIMPFLLGCFLFTRTETLKKVGFFDDRFFMYMEDLDFCRRFYKEQKVLFYPNVNIFHYYEKGSSRNLVLLKYHFISMIKYFNKWGWFFDKEKNKINEEVISNLS